MVRKMSLLFTAVILLMWVIGCSEGPSSSEQDPGELSLDDEFGGYTAKAEAPGFGEDDLLDEAAADEEYDDPMLTSPDVEELVEEPKAGYFHLRAVWGQLRYDSSVTEVTDWTGSLTLSTGAIIIRRAVHFELGQDYIPTRTDRQVVDWVSYTTVHNDGIAVDLFVPPSFDTTWVEDINDENDTVLIPVVDTVYPNCDSVTVAFETGPYRRTFTLSELKALDTVITLDDSNAVAFHAFQLHRMRCPRGFLAGYWGHNEEGEGQFRGLWMNPGGRVNGYVKGHFGQNEDGLDVFFGKWISENGQFEGFIKGTYRGNIGNHHNPNAIRRSGGSFQGYIYAADRTRIGVLKGIYKNGRSLRDGFFQARWKIHCGENEPITDDSEEGF